MEFSQRFVKPIVAISVILAGSAIATHIKSRNSDELDLKSSTECLAESLDKSCNDSHSVRDTNGYVLVK
ncbi:hypothetical protein ACQKPX_00730 [Photobacterium sp. DNB23_23_1]|uniref:Uncharacterized protein n=1 Tax=Photobacterium pectinilyticum TaxID=2906793 RepID=A0ABT1N7F6_9GAMM|nr:hypothetical protein [Photobacterium sp. ZSDE20]MCQ1060482.1 hypothetical protein [Photobacterium sp. ZSDE20]MDD1827882.1 hypothetical protein [Photobacterium sp. ZSDE20]